MSAPRLTIVTAVRNGAATLERCIDSVAAQSYPHLEHVIVDGDSRDATIDILHRHKEKIRFVSEPDKGIYDAMNKGVAIASGDWVLFLGADDCLAHPGAVAALLADCPEDLSPFGILTGYARYQDGRLYRSDSPEGLRWRNRIHHQGALYRHALLVGHPFDIQLRVYADYEFNLAAWLKGVTLFHTTQLLSELGPEGVSDRPRWRNYREEMRVRARHLRGPVLWLGHVFSVGRYLYKKLRRFANGFSSKTAARLV